MGFWAAVKFVPKIGAFIKTAKPIVKVIIDGMKGPVDISDEKVKSHLVELELRVGRLETELARMDKTLRNLTTAMYLLGGVAIAALLLAIIRLA